MDLSGAQVLVRAGKGDKDLNPVRRHHAHPAALQRAFKTAVE